MKKDKGHGREGKKGQVTTTRKSNKRGGKQMQYVLIALLEQYSKRQQGDHVHARGQRRD